MLLTKDKSFIYIRNTKGPKPDPCGTQADIGSSVDI